ncbi:prefoldin subunit beta [Candidatus Woesearchaeota archaeon]|nr:prefoldin subunit beta [Candidatus Woesearchaeota archaeon]
MANVSKEMEGKISELQMMEQNLQGFLLQKQAFQSQLVEVESALSEIGKTPTAYKIIGNIMVAADKDEVKQDLEQKKEMLTLRIKTLEKQETKIKEKASKMQSEVMEEMKKR